LKKVTTALAPSTFAASYNSLGMFCKIPVVVNIVKGTPIQILTHIMVILARVGSVKNGMDSLTPITPIFRSIILTGPLGLKIVFIVSKDTN